MKELVSKFSELEKEISIKKGAFTLFALFLREEAGDKWDLVVAAPWIEANRKEALSFMAKQTQAKFKPDELVNLSRIVLIDQNNPALDAINRTIKIEHGSVDVQSSNFFGLQIKHAYIVTSLRPSLNAEVAVA